MSAVDAPAPTKRCSKCAEVKPLTAFNRRAASPDGRQAYCRECDRATVRAAQQARRAEGRCQQTGCPHMAAPGHTRCAEHLAAKRARHREHADAGLCPKCGEPAAPGRRRCSEHLAAQRARDRARVAEGRAAAAKRARRERYIAQGLCERGPGHGPAVPGTTTCARCRARDQKRYRRTLIEYTAILADQGVDHDGRCELCGLAEATEVDHVLPSSLGGQDDDPLLLRWACRSCNASRGNNTEWVPALTAWDVEEQDR